MKTDWDAYALFAAVARSGGLTQAVAETGVSAATLSRRMKSLESRLGRRL
ncbi:MAG: LysR family transcriptional regulator, partial [Pseudomonadota bacterium]